MKRDGSLWAMGSNSAGQLGDGTIINRKSPVQVASHVVAVSAGDRFSLFLREDGTLWGMGVHSNNQLGLGYGGNTTVAGIVYSTAYPQTYKPSLIASGVSRLSTNPAGRHSAADSTGMRGVSKGPSWSSCRQR